MVGISLTNNSVIPNSPSAIMTYTKTRHASYLDPVVENLQISYTNLNAISLPGSETNTVCFEFDLPENEYMVNGWWYEYSDFMIVMTCRGFFPLGTSGPAEHWAVGYYSHAETYLTASVNYQVGVEYNQDSGFTGVFMMTIEPEYKEDVIEARVPVHLPSTYG